MNRRIHPSPYHLGQFARRTRWLARAIAALIVCLLALRQPVGAALEFATAVREGGQLRLQWSGGTGPFQLEESDAPGGPWTARGEPTSESSALVSIEHAQRYFRVAGANDISTGEASLRATLIAIDDFSSNVPREDRAVWRSQMLAFLKARPDINDAGETPDGLWAITENGIPLAFWNNRRADPAGEDDLPGVNGRSGTETPGKNPARLAVTVGSGFTHATPRLGRLLRNHGFSTTADTATLDSLKGTRPEPVFFLNTHGGVCYMPIYTTAGVPARRPDGTISYASTYGLWTGTKVDPRKTDFGYSHDEFVAELKAQRLGLVQATFSYKLGTGGVEDEVREWRFCITDEWIKQHMRFPAENHASVWLAVCRSGSDDAAPIRDAFRSVGAEIVSGWTEAVTGEGILAATSFIYDRLLGANEVLPPATPQRPFDYPNVWDELRSRGLHRHPTRNTTPGEAGTSDIIYQGATGDGSFGLFAPSLAYVLVDEATKRLHLVGLFGNPPADERQILVGGVECQNGADWGHRKITCPLPLDGPGSHGDVQVIVRGRKSNVRQLSKWTIFGDYKRTEIGTPFGIDGTMKLIFRADIGEYRKVPGNVFIQPTRYAAAAAHSEVILRAYGTETEDCGQGEVSTTTWSGSGPFPVRTLETPPDQPWHTIAALVLNTIDNQGGLGIAFGTFDPTQGPLKLTYTPCEGPPFIFALPPVPPGDLEDQQIIKSSTEATLPDGSDIELVLPGKSFSLGTGGTIPADVMKNGREASLTWSATGPESPPDPDAAR